MSKTVLLIDDDEDDREIFGIALRQLDDQNTYLAVSSGRDAVKMLSRDGVRPDLIFLDINMPVMAGKDCLAALRQIDRLKDVPIYMYTTSFHVPDRDVYLSLGALEVLNKPTRISDLVKMLKARL